MMGARANRVYFCGVVWRIGVRVNPLDFCGGGGFV